MEIIENFNQEVQANHFTDEAVNITPCMSSTRHQAPTGGRRCEAEVSPKPNG